MKNLKNYIIESKITNKLRNLMNKVLHPFSQTYNLPYIAIVNGNCYAPYTGTVNYEVGEVNDVLVKCNDFLNKNYGHIITKKYRKITDDIDEGIVYELENTENVEVEKIFKDLTNELSKQFEYLYKSKKYNNLKVKLDNYMSPDGAYVNSYTFEIELLDENGEFLDYIYPGAILVTHDQIKVFKK